MALKSLSLHKLIHPSQVSKYNSYCWKEYNGLGRYLGKFRNSTELNPNIILYHFDYHTIQRRSFIDGVDTKVPINLKRVLDEACIPSPEEFQLMSIEEIKQFIPETEKNSTAVYLERIGPIHNEIKQQLVKAENRLKPSGGKTNRKKKQRQRQSKRLH